MSSTTCPYCGRSNEAHAPTGKDYETPEAGDVSVCWKCHNLAIFQADGSVREATPEEDTELREAPEIRDVLMALKKSSLGPTKTAELLRHAEAWEAGELK